MSETENTTNTETSTESETNVSATEITDNINGTFNAEDEFVPPQYETEEDKDKDKYYYFLRPFPVEGQYVMEIFTRCDEREPLEKEISECRIKERNLYVKISDFDSSFYKELNQIYSKDDFWPFEGVSSATLSGWYLAIKNALQYVKVTYPDKAVSALIEDFGSSLTPSDLEFISGVIQMDSLISENSQDDFHRVMNYLQTIRYDDEGFPIDDSADKDRMKELFIKELEYFNTKCNFLLKNTSDLYKYDPHNMPKEIPSGTDTNILWRYDNVKNGRQILYSTLLSLTNKCDKKVKWEIELKDLKKDIAAKEEDLSKYGSDREFVAYKLLNRNPSLPDEHGLYRVIEYDKSNNWYFVYTKSIKYSSYLDLLIVDNTELYEGYEHPDRYMIYFDKETFEFTVYCNKDGMLFPKEGILTYKYKEGTSATLGSEFNKYECHAIERYKTTFKYFNDVKVFRTKCVDANIKGELGVRYSLFDAKKPYPITETKVDSDPISKEEWEKKPLKERLKYHEQGKASNDMNLQTIMEQMEKVKPLIGQLMPVTQVMGPLEPLMSTLESVKSTVNTLKSVVESFKSAVNTIASLPIVGVVASPFNMVLDMIFKVYEIITILYIKNYELIQKLKELKEKVKPEEIEKQITEIEETIEEKQKQMEEERAEKKKLEANGTMKDNDKTKMDIFSRITESTKIQGSGDSLMDNFNAKALLPAVPKEVMDAIDKVKETTKTIKETVETIKTMKEMGDSFDQAMSTITTISAAITGSPPMDVIIEQLKTTAESKVEQKYEKQIKELEEKHKELKKKANEKKYVITETVPVEVPLEQVVDPKEAQEAAIPKVEN